MRHKLTRKERDIETGLDYFEARYYSSPQGRFTSPDEFTGGPHEIFEAVLAPDPLLYAEQTEPQSFNKYSYCLGNPLRYVDPDGHQTKQADALIVSTPATTERALNILVGVGKVVANIGIGMNNSVVGAKPVEPYHADNMTQGITMVVTEDLTIFGALLGGRAQVGGVAVAEAEGPAVIASEVGNAERSAEAGAGSSANPFKGKSPPTDRPRFEK